MGCASSTPMIQTTGSEMLKAATHVATDATKTAEDAVEGLKDSVGKTLETAKDSVATTVESVKHEVENVVKEKSEMVGDATNALMEKLHLKQTENEGNNDEDVTDIDKTETDELKTQLNENLKNASELPPQQMEMVGGMMETFVAATDTETDSLKTSTPEPEIEQALAKSREAQEDGTDSPATPKPSLAELENLRAEVLKQQQQENGQTLVNDSAMNNDPLLMSVMHEDIKTLDATNMNSSKADNNTIKDNQPAELATTTAAATTTMTTTTTTTTTTLTNNDDMKSADVHKTHETNHSPNSQVPQRPLTLAASATATVAATAQSNALKGKSKLKLLTTHKKEEKLLKKIDTKCEEKRPGTTEWERFADMLAQVRKFNPHDAYRRGGTLTKFGGNVAGHVRERSLLGAHHTRNVMDDDNSDTASTFRPSPQNSQRSSARPMGNIELLPNRPKTGSSRHKPRETATNNPGGHYAYKTRGSSHNSSATGRKFYYNPTRSRIHDFVSSSPFIESYLQNTVNTPAPYSQSYESVKSLANMRSHHSRSDIINLPPLECHHQQRTRSHSQQEFTPQNHHHQHFKHDGDLTAIPVDYNGSTRMQNVVSMQNSPIITPPSSNTSLSSNSSHVDHSPAFKSSNLDLRVQPKTPQLPVKNTSSFLTTPRCSPFGLTKSYTDLYFSTTCNEENKQIISIAKSPFRARKNLNLYSKKYSIK